ncbi:MAG TPA: aldolase [Phycisphaerales bacterium]|nr:aldolase [Phycisphaerales bacterium]
MHKPTLKERLKNGETVFGTWNSIASSSLVNVIGCSGIDFLVIDAEHGPINMESAENLIRAAELSGTAAIIRVSDDSSCKTLRALDIGAHGVQVPHVSTKAQAEQVVKNSKYHPLGDRGFSPFTRAGKYGLQANEHTKRSNENTMVVINVEGLEGVENLPGIAEVEGIDVIFIGPYDLSQSLGKPGDVEDIQVIDNIKKCVKICKDKDLACGSFARDLKYLDILLDCGVQYITYSVDSAILRETYKGLYETFNEKRKARAGE